MSSLPVETFVYYGDRLATYVMQPSSLPGTGNGFDLHHIIETSGRIKRGPMQIFLRNHDSFDTLQLIGLMLAA
jgi:hypothetical protein